MLELIDIKKDYKVAGGAVHALKGVSIKFRKNEFVSILGASGCGKTTLLNIIGGLDKYTSGDLIIEGTSTKEFKDGDWDTYRNHSIGFIFQSYHLIPHQTILQNVELALTISGVSKEERRKRAIDALEKVGLADKINTRPNQLSGGQAQRVAIARALINDPEIVLADEPTGALDSKTSVQIMELLKEISGDRLVIMVTHNPELAEQYSTRIIRLLDGEIIDDTMPYDGSEENAEQAEVSDSTGAIAVTQPEPEVKKSKGKKKKSSMGMGMAFMLSLKNLLSKGKRTALVSVAGSIGIIGVSMVLAISAGVTSYINDMEDDMLSGYPVSVTRSAIDFTSLMDMNHNAKPDVNITKLDDKIYVNSLMETLGTFATGFSKMNVITENYIDYVEKMPSEYYNVLQYGYDFSVANNIYTDFKVTENSPLDGSQDASANMSVTAIRSMYSSILDKQPEYKMWANTISTVATFSEVPDNYEYILSQYDVIASGLKGDSYTAELTQDELKQAFASKDTLIMVVENMDVNDLVMGQFGYMTEQQFLNYAYKAVNSDDYDPELGLIGEKTQDGQKGLTYDYFLGESAKSFKYYSNNSVYREATAQEKTIYKMTANKNVEYVYNPYSKDFAGDEEGVDLKVKLILQKKDGLSYGCLQSGFYYTNALTKYILETEKNSEIVKFINENDKLEMVPYTYRYSYWKGDTLINSNKSLTDMTDPENPIGSSVIMNSDSSSVMNMLMSGLGSGGADISVTAAMLGGSDMPSSVNIFPVDFDYKTLVTDYLDAWNDACDGNTLVWKDANGNAYQAAAGDAIALRWKNSNGGEVRYELENMSGKAFNKAFKECKTAIERGYKVYAVTEGGEFEVAVEALYFRSAADYHGDLSLVKYTREGANGPEYGFELGEKDKITYTDTVGLIISMVNTMIQMITIALIAFTALSLVVSTVMVGIITYVSVVERIKEIGILRAVGARKKDIKRLFNAETFIIGLAAGVVGILITYLLSMIINIIVGSLTGIYTIAALPVWQALIMICISVVLTLISGLIPAAAAAKKDPVVALRTE